MAKKSFADVIDDNPALAFISSPVSVDGNEPRAMQDSDAASDGDASRDEDDVNAVPIVQKTTGTKAEQDVRVAQDDEKLTYCRINLRLPQEYKDFLENESWRVRKNVTQYLIELIEADIRKKQQ